MLASVMAVRGRGIVARLSHVAAAAGRVPTMNPTRKSKTGPVTATRCRNKSTLTLFM
jgi:hypothetical protein